jgi:acyl-CoA synthetase (AMP-forming)/AMP-acid ligase II
LPVERTLLNVLGHGSASDLAIVVPGGVRMTYRQLREQVEATADGLAHRGVGHGDRVAYVYPNTVEAIVLFLAASTVGTAAPLNATYKEDEFRFYLEDIGARALVVPPGEAKAARQALPDGVTLIEAHIDGSGLMRLESKTTSSPTRSAETPGDDDVAAPRAGLSWSRFATATCSHRSTTSRPSTRLGPRMWPYASCPCSTFTA